MRTAGKIWGFLVLIVGLAVTVHAFAAPPKTISYQGYLKAATGKPVTAPTSIVFSLYSSNPARNNPVWRETQGVTPVNGVYSVSLGSGSGTSLNLPFDIPYFLGVAVGSDPELTPLQPLTSAPYAFRAAAADTLTSGASVPGATPWAPTASSTVQATANNGYLLTGTTPTAITLPTNATMGDIIKVNAQGGGGYIFNLANGQTITGAGIPTDYSIWTPRDTLRNWAAVASSADGARLVAVDHGGLIYTSGNSGVSWSPHESVRNWAAVASSADGTKLVAAEFGGLIYTSVDSGGSWTPRDAARYWNSVASSADGTKLVAVADTGRIYTSGDSGATWIPRDSIRYWRSVASSADGTKLVAVVSGISQTGQTMTGLIYTSSDSGVTWIPRDTTRNWRSVASSADGTKLVAVVSVITSTGKTVAGQIYTSVDSGVTWTPRDSLRMWWSVASSADGARLVAMVKEGQIYTSGDSGATWTPHDTARNWLSVASSADGSKLVAADSGGLIYTGGISVFSAGTGIPADYSIWTPRENSRNWAAVASSADGTKLVAVDHGGLIYTSENSGVSWSPHESVRNWYAVASSADGTKLVAAEFNGLIYTSTDSGGSWTPRDAARYWNSVASSADGTKLVAVADTGRIYTSGDSGATWIPRDSVRYWRSVASSADGAKLVAVVSGISQTGQTMTGLIFTSVDSGVTWIPRDTARNWRSVASSADGTRLVAVVSVITSTGQTVAGQIYTSVDSGVTWIPRDSPRMWWSVASSADGARLVAVVKEGQIYTSGDSGATWTPHETARNWLSAASSADGSRLVAADYGGLIYTGGTGVFPELQFSSAELIYSGNSQWLVNGPGSLGQNNSASGSLSTIGGGYANTASGTASVISGGSANTATGFGSIIGGGSDNTASGAYATVPGGYGNSAGGAYSFAAGNRARVRDAVTAGTATGDQGAFVWADSSAADFISTGPNQFLIRAAGGVGINTSTPHEALTIGGNGSALELGSDVAGKEPNAGKIAYQRFGTNDALDIVGAGPINNRKIHLYTEGGATIDGPVTITGSNSLNFGATIRQMLNLYNLNYGIGVQPNTLYSRSDSDFVWYAGGVHSDIKGDPGGGQYLMGLSNQGLWVNGTFVSSSDRNAKENFAPVDAQEVLDKVMSLPLQSWNYRNDEQKTRHLGPMAQDFHAAFNLGKDDKTIATVDADGVALAAIQALKAENDKLKADNEALHKRLARIEKLLRDKLP